VDTRQRLEGLYTAHRLLELRLAPVAGRFDTQHLKEINRRIFQDLPRLGFTDVTPGHYRAPVPAGRDWVKQRKLASVASPVCVAYSPMDAAAQAQLDTVLNAIDPAHLAVLKTDAFIQAMAALYVQLDYLHPFADDNSRTLREFTHQLAQESGYLIDWAHFSKQLVGRDLLYIARDLSVNALALPHVRHDDTRRDILYSMDILAGNRTLLDLLRDVIRPSRAAF